MTANLFELRREQRSMRFTWQAMKRIDREVFYEGVERAAMLIGPKGAHLVTHVVPDEGGQGSPGRFELDHEGLNELLQDYLRLGMTMLGIVHSHPPRVTEPSEGDVNYVRETLARSRNGEAEEFWLPIVSGNTLHGYMVGRDGRVRTADILLI